MTQEYRKGADINIKFWWKNFTWIYLYFPIIISFLAIIVFKVRPVQASLIWKIGQDNAGNNEFGGHYRNELMVNYEIPPDWFSATYWEFFPVYLSSPQSPLSPPEIHLIFEYLKDHRYTELNIKARSEAGSCRLVVIKGDEEWKAIVDSSYSLFKIPLGFIQQGDQPENTIILKNEPISDNYVIFIDYLEFYNQDDDGDGSLNSEEGEEDTDQDGDEDKSDSDTASILIQTYDQAVVKRITFDIEEEEYTTLQFQNLALIDGNSSDFPQALPEDIFFLYGLCKINILTPSGVEKIPLKVFFPESIDPLARFYTYSENGGWEKLPTEMVNENGISTCLEVNRVGNGEEGTLRKLRTADDTLSTFIGGLAYPLKMNIALEKQGCFVSSLLFPGAKKKLATLFIVFQLLLFSLFQYCLYYEIIFFIKDKQKGSSHNFFWAKGYLIILIILLCLFLKVTSARAIIFPDMKMNATPNPIGSGARALGIGGAFIAIADDATAASWNPAALLNLKRPEISMVGSYFSGNEMYNTSAIQGNIKDLSQDQKHLNYFSVAYPFALFRRNMVFSLNYQHFYEFSQDSSYNWRYLYEESGLVTVDIPMNSHKKQKGSLNTVSPALAIQILPSLSLGLTANFWLDDELHDYWENITIVKGEGIALDEKIETYAEFYEKYEFSGFNAHIGLLWKPTWWFSLGAVVKTPFRADIRHTSRSVSKEEYPQNIAFNSYEPPHLEVENLGLEMPISYGLGTSIRFCDRYLASLDIYYTQWDNFFLDYPTGEKISPINHKTQDKADIQPTTQIRLGIEYIAMAPRPIIPFRVGFFYDPEPSGGSVNDFYGASIGTGIKHKRIAFDLAYQYRFGQRKKAEQMLEEEISSKVKQHYLYSSLILYY